MLNLSNYYSQSTGKAAKALHDRICTIYSWKGPSPRELAPFDMKTKADETPERRALRCKYWKNTVRPLVADAEFITSLTKTTVRVADMRITTEMRDQAIAVLKESVEYWDKHFAI